MTERRGKARTSVERAALKTIVERKVIPELEALRCSRDPEDCYCLGFTRK